MDSPDDADLTYDLTGRLRAVRAWFDDFPPSAQERLLSHMEHLITLARQRDMPSFMVMADQVFALITQLEQENT
jgi:hypothetical protein